MKDPEHDDLWALLGRAKTQEPSQFFTAKVMAAVRQVNERRSMFWRNWLRYGLPGALAGALAVFVTLVTIPHGRNADTRPIIVAQTEPSDVAVIADLDYNLASEESSVWLDSSAQ